MKNKKDSRTFPNILHELLEEVFMHKGISLNEVAEAIGLSKGTLSKYQNGEVEPRISTAAKLAEYFGVTLDYLTGLSEYRTNPAEEHGAELQERTGLNNEALNNLVWLVDQKEQSAAVVGDNLTDLDFMEYEDFARGIAAESALGVINHFCANKNDLLNLGIYMNSLKGYLYNLTHIPDTAKNDLVKYISEGKFDTNFYENLLKMSVEHFAEITYESYNPALFQKEREPNAQKDQRQE